MTIIAVNEAMFEYLLGVCLTISLVGLDILSFDMAAVTIAAQALVATAIQRENNKSSWLRR